MLQMLCTLMSSCTPTKALLRPEGSAQATATTGAAGGTTAAIHPGQRRQQSMSPASWSGCVCVVSRRPRPRRMAPPMRRKPGARAVLLDIQPRGGCRGVELHAIRGIVSQFLDEVLVPDIASLAVQHDAPGQCSDSEHLLQDPSRLARLLPDLFPNVADGRLTDALGALVGQRRPRLAGPVGVERLHALVGSDVHDFRVARIAGRHLLDGLLQQRRERAAPGAPRAGEEEGDLLFAGQHFVRRLQARGRLQRGPEHRVPGILRHGAFEISHIRRGGGVPVDEVVHIFRHGGTAPSPRQLRSNCKRYAMEA
mmetsp:Transcript_47631/g.152077  ORF Transcript_47631/g.152077 Transcript_47631/m.152077 type:complete len:310 (-) Transcript_47631:14-943(-)